MIRRTTKFKMLYVIVLVGILLSSCLPRLTAQEKTADKLTVTQTESTMATAKISTEPLPGSTFTPNPIDQVGLIGPLLLLQTSVDSYHILDIATNGLIPYDLPGINPEVNLASMQSPDGKQLIIFTSEHGFEIIDISSKQDDFSYDFTPNETRINIDQILEDVSEGYEGDLTSAIEATVNHGRKAIKWYQDNKKLLIISESLGTSTNLALLDLTTGETVLLETRPGLVEKFLIGPSDDKILVRKGYSITSNDWHDDEYILVDLAEGTTTDVPLPPNVDNPSVFWFSEDQIGIIHQMDIVGGTDFSLIDISDMEMNPIVTGSFSDIYAFGDDILTLSQDRDLETTTLTIRSVEGEIKNTRELSGVCSPKRKISGTSLLLNCDTHSLIIENKDLIMKDFGEPVFLFSRSPNRQINIVITKTNKIYFFFADLSQKSEISLQGEPLEIIWLRDSSGFLYRTSTDLHLYDIHSQTDRFILSSSLFGDYRNINAIWLGDD